MPASRSVDLLAVLTLAACTATPAGDDSGDAGTAAESTGATTRPSDATSDEPGETGEPTTSDPTADPTDDPAAVTYHAHVRPILARTCEHCHVSGGIAPLALDSYADAKIFSALIASQTAARIMPPYPADNSGACNSFRDARWLSDEDIATLAAWHDGGALEGDPATPPPSVPPLPTLTGDVRTVAMPVSYTPDANMPDDYRCFVVDNPATGTGDSFITGFDVHPGDPRIVHHVVVFAPDSDDAVAQAEAKDAADDGPGYECFGTAQVSAEIAAAWAPGGGAQRFPDDTGVKIKTGGKLVLQVHYNTLAAPGAPDLTAVDLEIATSGITAAEFVPLADTGLNLPPGQSSAPTSMTTTLANYGYSGLYTVHGVFPHMHLLGRTLSLTASHDGSDICLIDVPRWDFHWQFLYFYDAPGVISSDTPLTLDCDFDTTTRDTQTQWGEGTGDEMCVAGLWVSKQN